MGRTLVAMTVAALIIGTAACSTTADTTRVGGDAAPTVLQLGTPDAPNQGAAPIVTEFASRVEELSGGTLRIEPVWQAGGENVPNWDQEVARLVMAGDLEMGMIPARAWDTEGVTSLRALQAPFLVDSDALVRAIADGDIGDTMLSGLDAAGVTGLALFPEEMRRVFSFGEPMTSPDDFDGARLRAPTSATSEAVFKALGATADDISGDPFTEAVQAGDVEAAESAFLWARGLPAATTTTSNIVLFPKMQTLVIGSGAFDDLTDAHREALVEAVDATRAWADGHDTTDLEDARDFCGGERGGVVAASEDEVAAFHDAVRPVYAELERDVETADLIDRIRDLKASLPPPPEIPTCEPPAAPVADGSSGEEDVAIDGVWRYELSVEDFTSAGVPRASAEQEAGVHTVTLDGGRMVEEWEQPGGLRVCEGTYEIVGDRVTFAFQSGCDATWAATASVDGDQITWSEIDALPPWDAPDDQLLDEVYGTATWVRIDAAQSVTVGDFPEGSYRVTHTLDSLTGQGLPPQEAGDYLGMWTLSFVDGDLTVSDAVGDCEGTYSVSGARVELVLGDAPACGSAARQVFWTAGWTAEGSTIRFTDLESPDPSAQQLLEALFAAPTWTRVD